MIEFKVKPAGGKVNLSNWGFAQDKLGKLAASLTADAIQSQLNSDETIQVWICATPPKGRKPDPLGVSIILPLGNEEHNGPSFFLSLRDLPFAISFDWPDECEMATEIAKELRKLADELDKRVTAVQTEPVT